MTLSKIEALEWAADYAARTQLFEIPPVSARDRYEIIDNLAEAAMLASPPSVRTVETKVPTDPKCIEYIEYQVGLLRGSSSVSNRIQYRNEIVKHLEALKHPDAVHPPHPAIPEPAEAAVVEED